MSNAEVSPAYLVDALIEAVEYGRVILVSGGVEKPELDAARSTLVALLASRAAEIELLRSDNATLRADVAKWKGRFWWYVRDVYKATEDQYARLLIKVDAALRGEKP